MADLIHGGDIYTAKERGVPQVTDFSANINPLGLPQGVKDALIQGLDLYSNYPDPLCRDLREALSKKERVPMESILCGNGAADLIFRLVLARKPKKALVPAPTFAEYELALNTVECQVNRVVLEENEGFALGEDFPERLEKDLDILFLCNPNNPTGRLIPRVLLERILKRCREWSILLVLDECFLDFVDEGKGLSLGNLISEYDNLFVLKAFTKNFAMPGLRLGYGLSGDQILLEEIHRMGQPWSVSLPAQLAGVAALKEQGYLEQAAELLAVEKAFLLKGLSAPGIKTYPPAANYILLRFLEVITEDQNLALKEALFNRGILIRDCSNYWGLSPGYYRIAVKNREDNEKLISALKEIKEEQPWQRQL